MLLNEVGLELELFLLKDNKILEPSLYGFPADEMGFLVEVRSHHSSEAEEILKSLTFNWQLESSKAERLGFYLVRIADMPVTKAFQHYISNKYKHHLLSDYTRNIYGIRESHHTGLIDSRATAGLHVHFSSRKVEGTRVEFVPFDFEEVVRRMDKEFREIVKGSRRVLGEWEPKSHGFEYRSLPATAPLEDVVEKSLRILEEVVSESQKEKW